MRFTSITLTHNRSQVQIHARPDGVPGGIKLLALASN
ncbi:unnamed protein product [Linum tenue]|uniref:Uncharacterized protein n=1 Tax=Linum tenue TaxID=586396 RepID=A0AAV0MLL1_9ROSI|nr:unnamed protein product [Linum tenue]